MHYDTTATINKQKGSN